MNVPMVAFVFMVVVSDQPLPFAYIDQGILKSVRRSRCFWNVVGFHFYQPSLLVHIPRVEDQLRFRHMAVDTITGQSVKEGIVNSSTKLSCCTLIGRYSTRYCEANEL